MDPRERVPEEHIFHFRDGDQAHSIQDLRDVIENMPEDEFAHHVDELNNDFANWVEFVSKNVELADDLRKVTTQKQTVEVLDTELGKYTGGLEAPSEPKQLHEDPITPTTPPQMIEKPDGTMHPTISTQATHKFIVKEFLLGAALGFIVGLVLMAVLINLSVF